MERTKGSGTENGNMNLETNKTMPEKGALASDDVASSKEARSGKLAAALFYAGASLSTVFVMKIVLTTYTFPSAMFLGLCQFVLTTFIFVSLSATGRIQEIRPPRRDVFFRVLPITLVSENCLACPATSLNRSLSLAPPLSPLLLPSTCPLCSNFVRVFIFRVACLKLLLMEASSQKPHRY